MGVGYTASALHGIAYLDVDGEGESIEAEATPASESEYIRSVLQAPETTTKTFGSYTSDPKVVAAWRDRLAIAWETELGERLFWDEESEDVECEEAYVSGVVLFHYLAGLADEGGAAAVNALAGAPEVGSAGLDRVFRRMEERGRSGRFPQLMVSPNIWLPFERNLIFEAEDWRGKLAKLGSLYRLADEVRDLRAMIRASDPSVVEWTDRLDPAQDNVLASAWQASESLARTCAVAVAKRLPFWTTG